MGVLSSLGPDLCGKFSRGYTREQWGLDRSELAAGVAYPHAHERANLRAVFKLASAASTLNARSPETGNWDLPGGSHSWR